MASMADLNAAIKAAVGTPSATGSNPGEAATPAASSTLKAIASNGAQMNRQMGHLIKALNALTTTWGG